MVDQTVRTLDGRPWEQNPFTYQAKCLQWLREANEAPGRRRQGL